MNDEIAILMAAGLGTRMKPITNIIPKPLVKVKNTPLIETIIDSLLKRQIKHIYIVVGYKKEKFYYLQEKYTNISFIENVEYDKKNNISSLKAVGNILGSSDCFICESDLFVNDESIFKSQFETSCYFGKTSSSDISEWGFIVNNNRIVQIKFDCENNFDMLGISYWKKKDAEIIRKSINEAYKTTGHEKLYWDEIVNLNLDTIYATINLLDNTKVFEIDSCKDLIEVNTFLKLKKNS